MILFGPSRRASRPGAAGPTSGGGGGRFWLLVPASLLTVTATGALLTDAPAAGAETCVRRVDATAAETPADADTALRDALSDAADPAAADCTAWRVELTGTFLLTSSLGWSRASPLTLIGPDGTTARLEATPATDGGTVTHRILTADTASTITIERLVLAGGDRSQASSTPLGNNEGGAILAEDVVLIDAELADNEAVIGGAVSAFTLTATRTSFVDNTAAFLTGRGGAVAALGAVTLENVTFTGNSALEGGAIWMDESEPLDATFVTFLGNASGAKDPDPAGGADLHRGVLLGEAPATVTLRGVLFGGVADHSDGPSCDGQDLSGAGVLTWEDAFATDASCGAPADAVIAAPSFTTVPVLTGTTALPVPEAGSATIGEVACGAGWPSTDQRGTSRPQGDACDAGAVERVAAAPPAPAEPDPEPEPEPEPEPDPEPAPAPAAPEPAPEEVPLDGPVPTAVPAGGGGCADGCPALSDRRGVPVPRG